MTNKYYAYVFGYGSLINLKSLSNALKREVTKEDVKTAFLENYKRAWTLKELIYFEDINEAKYARFLDLVQEKDRKVNGILFGVSEDEFKNLKIREKNYHMNDVSNLILPRQEIRVYTVFAKEEFLVDSSDGIVVPGKYVEMVESACKYLGNDFYTDYLNSTEDYRNYDVVEGVYKFVDEQQAKYV